MWWCLLLILKWFRRKNITERKKEGGKREQTHSTRTVWSHRRWRNRWVFIVPPVKFSAGLKSFPKKSLGRGESRWWSWNWFLYLLFRVVTFYVIWDPPCSTGWRLSTLAFFYISLCGGTRGEGGGRGDKHEGKNKIKLKKITNFDHWLAVRETQPHFHLKQDWKENSCQQKNKCSAQIT